MSSRNFRKLYGTNTLPPPNDSSDDDFEPLYVKNTVKSKFQGLAWSSGSELDVTDSEVSDERVTEVAATRVVPKIKNNKKNRRKGKHAPATSKYGKELDEIDQCVKVVNLILGPPPQPSSSQERPTVSSSMLMLVARKHLYYKNELTRVFGPADDEERNRRRPSNRSRLLETTIVPIQPRGAHFPHRELYMSLKRTEGGCKYFVFNHSTDYQNKVRIILHRLIHEVERHMDINLNEIATNTLTVEGTLENADIWLQYEQYNEGKQCLEQAIWIMQRAAHPFFNLSDRQVRLEYTYIENRPFHVALLKYMYVLTTKACHRTALELAKVLLNLDPSDPLAIIFIIDILAIRAREHRWLIAIVDHWTTERHARYLFNIQYSYAMAHFHVATRKKEDLSKADELLQLAILSNPSLVYRILECNGTRNAQIQSHELYTTFAESTVVREMKVLIILNAKLTCSWWTERPVMKWLIRNALEIARQYDNNPTIKKRAIMLGKERLALFRKYPVEMVRHLCIIQPLSELIIDQAVPHYFRTVSSNPSPESSPGVDRYQYYGSMNRFVSHGTTLLASFIRSIIP